MKLMFDSSSIELSDSNGSADERKRIAIWETAIHTANVGKQWYIMYFIRSLCACVVCVCTMCVGVVDVRLKDVIKVKSNHSVLFLALAPQLKFLG